MPHNSKKVIRQVDFHSDFSHYWMNTVVYFNGAPFRIKSIACKGNSTPQDYCDLMVTGLVMKTAGSDWQTATVSGEELTYEFPRLGFVRTNDGWNYLYRAPHRKMIKGLHTITVGHQLVGPGTHTIKFDVFKDSIIRQIFFGNTRRITPDCIIDDAMDVWYELEKVASIDKDGSINVVENHEKMGAYVCKLLANSSVARSLVPNLQINS